MRIWATHSMQRFRGGDCAATSNLEPGTAQTCATFTVRFCLGYQPTSSARAASLFLLVGQSPSTGHPTAPMTEFTKVRRVAACRPLQPAAAFAPDLTSHLQRSAGVRASLSGCCSPQRRLGASLQRTRQLFEPASADVGRARPPPLNTPDAWQGPRWGSNCPARCTTYTATATRRLCSPMCSSCPAAASSPAATHQCMLAPADHPGLLPSRQRLCAASRVPGRCGQGYGSIHIAGRGRQAVALHHHTQAAGAVRRIRGRPTWQAGTVTARFVLQAAA